MNEQNPNRQFNSNAQSGVGLQLQRAKQRRQTEHAELKSCRNCQRGVVARADYVFLVRKWWLGWNS